MSHTYANNFIQCIFSTKDRRPLIVADRKQGLLNYLGGIAKGEGFTLIAVGGTTDHIHLLVLLQPPYPLAQAIQKLKGSSSHWMGRGFSWQQGYGAFSISSSQLPVVQKYIENQDQHHKERGFEEDSIALLHSCSIDYDTRYVFG